MRKPEEQLLQPDIPRPDQLRINHNQPTSEQQSKLRAAVAVLAVNGLIGTSDSLALYVAGPALGGLLAALTSPELVLLVNGFSYTALMVAGTLAVPPTRSPEQAQTANAAETTSGWAILQRTPVALRLFLVVFLFNLFYGPVEVALPLLVADSLSANGRALGALWTSFGLGALCGALITNQLRRLPQRMLLVGIIGGWAMSVGLLAAAHLPSPSPLPPSPSVAWSTALSLPSHTPCSKAPCDSRTSSPSSPSGRPVSPSPHPSAPDSPVHSSPPPVREEVFSSPRSSPRS